MKLPDPRELALETLRDPKAAAGQVLALPLTTQIWWSALALVVVLNAFVYGLLLPFQPPIPVLPAITNNPISYALATGTMFAGLVFMFTMLGRMLGGQGQLEHVLALFTWLQAVQLVVLIATSVLGFLLPGLAGLVSLVITFYFFWITIVFLDRAHGFDSWPKALVLLILGHLAAAFILSILLLLIGANPMGQV